MYGLRHPRKTSPWARMAFYCVHRGRPQMIVYYVRSPILYQKQWRFGIFWSLNFFRSYWFFFYITCVCTLAHTCMYGYGAWVKIWRRVLMVGHGSGTRVIRLGQSVFAYWPISPALQFRKLRSPTLFIIMPLSRSEEDSPPWYTGLSYKEMWLFMQDGIAHNYM